MSDRFIAGVVILSCIFAYCVWEAWQCGREVNWLSAQCHRVKRWFWIERGWSGPYRMDEDDDEDEDGEGDHHHHHHH